MSPSRSSGSRSLPTLSAIPFRPCPSSLTPWARPYLRALLLYPPRLGYESLTLVGVALLADALRHLVLTLPEIVHLLHQLRTLLGEPHDQVHVCVDPTIP